MPRKNQNSQKWLTLSPESAENGHSDWKTEDQIRDAGLKWSKNGNQRHGKFFGLTKYIWEASRIKRSVVKIRTVGYDPDVLTAELLKNRPIAPRIYEHFPLKCS